MVLPLIVCSPETIDNDNASSQSSVEIKDINIDNKDIRHLNNGGNLSWNIGVQHEQEHQNNHFGGPVVDKHQPSHHLEGHNEGNHIDEEVDKVTEVG